jgi:hypothetical protein
MKKTNMVLSSKIDGFSCQQYVAPFTNKLSAQLDMNTECLFDSAHSRKQIYPAIWI